VSHRCRHPAAPKAHVTRRNTLAAAVLRALAYAPTCEIVPGIRATEARRAEMTNSLDIQAIRHSFGHFSAMRSVVESVTNSVERPTALHEAHPEWNEALTPKAVARERLATSTKPQSAPRVPTSGAVGYRAAAARSERLRWWARDLTQQGAVRRGMGPGGSV
jgi:hypothetical protein